ncbi:MAG: exopolysaccharide biosynthesis polyprenyl glycosylphosphotransferase [Clostridiales bacterium]|nr:exopolysaccharide biosynthesis polyprenyl glycosylphosphotransferase [Clostridiales bacterium]
MEREGGIKNYIILIIDVVIITLSYSLIILLSNPANEFFIRLLNIRKIIYAPVITVAIVLSFLDMYKSVYKRYLEVVFNSFLASLLGFLTFLVFINIRDWQLSHINLPFWIIFILVTVILIISRMAIEIILRKTYKKENVLVIACEKDGYKTSYNLQSNGNSAYIVDTLFITDTGVLTVETYIKKTDRIILGADINTNYRKVILQLCQKHHKKVFLIPEIYDISLMRPRLTQVDDTPYLYLDSIGLSKVEEDIKRVMDIILSILLIISLSPLLIISAFLVIFSSKGSVFFTQDRITKDNKVFKIIKFRTMVENAEKHTGAVLTKANDHRVTKVGAFMRKARLDELPQFFNVLKGDMSLIGPRPERPVFVKEFENSIPLYEKRHNVKTGITGLAQIMGKYSTAAIDKLRFDLIYIRNYTILLDIKIFFLTMKTAIIDLGSLQEEQHIDFKNEIESSKITIVRE